MARVSPTAKPAALLALGLISTIGYEVIEGYGWVDALYMTVITLGTIGYGEVLADSAVTADLPPVV